MAEKVASSERPKDPRRFRWETLILVMMYAGYAAMMLCRNTLIAASPAMIKDPSLNLDLGKYGRLMSWHHAGAIAGKLVSSVVADRIGGRALFLVALLLTLVSTAAFGMVSPFMLFALLNFSGQFFKSGGWPAMAKMIGAWYPKNTHGRVWSIISTSSRVGTISAGFLIGGLLVVMPWRGVFVVSAAIAGAILILGWFFLKAKPSEVDLSPPEETSTSVQERPSHPLDGTTLRQACFVFARSPRVWLICVGVALLTILMDFIIFIPSYSKDILNLEPSQAAMTLSVFPAGMFVALIPTSIFYDRFSKRTLIGVLARLLYLACGCILILWFVPSFPVSLRLPASIGAIFFLGVAVSPAYYIPMSVFSIKYGGKYSGFLICMIDVCGYSGALVFTYFGGSIARDYGWLVFLVALLAVGVGALVIMTTFLYLDHAREKVRA